MSPHILRTRRTRECFPRVSGDEPCADKSAATPIKFSPRERG